MSPASATLLLASTFLLSAAFAPPAAASCKSSEPVLTYTSTPPLLAPQQDSSLVVTVYADGCTSATFPSHDVRAGVYVTHLPPAQQNKLLADIESSGLRHLDANDLAGRLAEDRMLAKQGDGRVHAVRDENILSLVFHGAQGAQSDHELRWASLRQDLLYSPSDRDLLALDGLRRQLEQAAADIHAKSEQRR